MDCSVVECERPVKSHGWCKTHYERWLKSGNAGGAIGSYIPRSNSCSMDGCKNPVLARSWCRVHYKRWAAHGDPLKKLPIGQRLSTIEDRFWSHVNKTEGCWLWTAGTDEDGYGFFHGENHTKISSHRWAYQHFVGPIPEGLQIDHVAKNGCTNRNCVKFMRDEFSLAHLEPVTPLENVMRSRHHAKHKGKEL